MKMFQVASVQQCYMLTSSVHHQSIRKHICMLSLKSNAKQLTFIDELDIAGHSISQRVCTDCDTTSEQLTQREGEPE